MAAAFGSARRHESLGERDAAVDLLTRLSTISSPKSPELQGQAWMSPSKQKPKALTLSKRLFVRIRLLASRWPSRCRAWLRHAPPQCTMLPSPPPAVAILVVVGPTVVGGMTYS